MKKEILNKLKLNKEDALLLANILDKHELCQNKNFVTATSFLDLRQQGLVHLIKNEFKVKYELFGGFADAERKVLYFLPEWEEELTDHNLCLLNVTPNANKPLSHRDYLGSVLSLGIKRETIGDILVSDNGAQIITNNNMAEFLLNNYVSAGHFSLSCEIKELSSLIVPKPDIKTISDTVMSLRLDSAVSSCFSISRSQAVKAIESGKVFLNDLEMLKCDKQIKEGDKIILRGKGKAVITKASEKSKKGRIWLEIERYV